MPCRHWNSKSRFAPASSITSHSVEALCVANCGKTRAGSASSFAAQAR